MAVSTVSRAVTSAYDSHKPMEFGGPESTKESNGKKTIYEHWVDGLQTVKYAKDLALKVVYHTTGWMKEFMGDKMPPAADAFGTAARNTKNLLGFTELPEKALKVAQSLQSKSPTKTFLSLNDCVNPVYDGVSGLVATKVVDISEPAMKAFGAVNHGSLVIGQGTIAVENITALSKGNLNDDQKTSKMIALAKNVSYVALGVIGLSAFLLSIKLSSWILLAFSTSALFFSITSYFYDKVVEPNKEADAIRMRAAAPAA